MLESAKYKADCTWGDGPDILMSIELILGRESGKKFFFDLTPIQARILAAELTSAADTCDQTEKEVEEYFRKEKETIYNSHRWVNVAGNAKCAVCGIYFKDSLSMCGTTDVDFI